MKGRLHLLPLAVVLVLSMALLVAYLTGLRVNPTASMPVGLYRLCPDTPRRGDVVSLELAPGTPYAELAAERGYLGHGNVHPLLKRLAALPGDFVERCSSGVLINGVLQPHSQLREQDRAGRSLPSFLPQGEVPEGQALVLCDNPDGFDGRYFGLVDMARLVRAVPVITFTKGVMQ